MRTQSVFRSRFDELTKQRKYSQAFIAGRLGMSRQCFSEMMITGNPKYQTIKKIAEVIGVHPREFF